MVLVDFVQYIVLAAQYNIVTNLFCYLCSNFCDNRVYSRKALQWPHFCGISHVLNIVH